MVYVTVKEETDTRLHLSSQPGNKCWALLVGFFAFGMGAACYGNEHIIWKAIYVSLGVLVGISCVDDWEECDLNKTSKEIRLKKHTIWDVILSPFTGKDGMTIVAHLPDVIDVRVEDQAGNYFGSSHQVVLVFNNGMSIGITEQFTFGPTQEHSAIADKIRGFLGIDKQHTLETSTGVTSDHHECSSSSEDSGDTADDFEQIDKSELMDETEGQALRSSEASDVHVPPNDKME